MFKAFVVDDEPSVTEGMKLMIPWNELDFDLCGTASDAQEAISGIKEMRPHLLVSDISMPYISGLELINEARKLDIDMEFIILSGYSEFEYAKEAMRNQVSDYLLKPLDRDEIIDAIQRIKNKLDKSFLKKYGFTQDDIEAFKKKRSLWVQDIDDIGNEAESGNVLLKSFNNDFDEELAKAIKLMDKTGANKLIDGIFDFFRHRNVSAAKGRMIVNSCIYQILRIAFERNIRLSSFFPINTSEDWDLDIMKKNITDILSNMIDIMLEDRRKNSRSYLYEVKEYIEENFSSELTVSGLAEMKFIEAGYLGEAFIKQFGCSISEYQHRLRIKKAIELISTTDMKLSDISTAVGYNNYNNFFWHFEKITHKKPHNMMP